MRRLSNHHWSAPSHYLNQWWNIVNWTLRNKLQWNLNRNLKFSFKKIRLKVSSAKWRLFFLGLNVLIPLAVMSEAYSTSQESCTQLVRALFRGVFLCFVVLIGLFHPHHSELLRLHYQSNSKIWYNQNKITQNKTVWYFVICYINPSFLSLCYRLLQPPSFAREYFWSIIFFVIRIIRITITTIDNNRI